MAGCEVFIGNVALSCTDSDMRRLFDDTPGLPLPTSIRINKRFAFVSLKDKKSAENAVRKLNGVTFLGDILRVELGKTTGKSSQARRSGPTRRQSPVAQYSRSRSTGQLESTRYPYGEPPSYRSSRPSPPSLYRPYTGYPLVHRYESVQHCHRPSVFEPVPTNLAPEVLGIRPQNEFSFGLNGHSRDGFQAFPGHYGSLDGAGDGGRYGMHPPSQPSQYSPYQAKTPYEDGRYGSRLPLPDRGRYEYQRRYDHGSM